MIWLQLFRCILGCVTALVFDWGFFEAVVFRLRGEAWPGDFTYGQSRFVRKAAMCIAGGLAGLLWDSDFGRAAAVSAALVLHLAIYAEWYRSRT